MSRFEGVPEFTVVLGLDAKTLPYFEVTNPSWLNRYPELINYEWKVFYDSTQIRAVDIFKACPSVGIHAIPWKADKSKYDGQRAFMLAGHVYISRLIDTKYFLKIDADAVALERGPWPDPAWFEPQNVFADREPECEEDSSEEECWVSPVLVGPGWGYTRAKGNQISLVDWCEILESFGDRHTTEPRLNWKDRIGSWNHPKGPKLREKRWVSWVGFQRTDWVQMMAQLFEEDYGIGLLPVPSHDTSLWYCAQRMRAPYFIKTPRPHWTNRVSLRGCKKAVEDLKL